MLSLNLTKMVWEGKKVKNYSKKDGMKRPKPDDKRKDKQRLEKDRGDSYKKSGFKKNKI